MTTSNANLCVLFAGVCGTAQFHEKLGETEANHALARCFNRIERASVAHKGRVIKSAGEELVALFETPDDALAAACEMQQRIENLPPASGLKISIRVAFHHGAVLVSDGDAVGDTVDLAARLVKLSLAGQIIATAETVEMLPSSLRESARDLGSSHSDGKLEDLRLFELSWRDGSDMPMMQTIPPPEVAAVSWLRLLYGEQELVLNQFRTKASLGRGVNCDIVIKDPRASRSHATIERRRDKFVVIDQSANGTFVSVDGEVEILLKRDDAVLRGRGFLSFGHHHGVADKDVVEFEVMTVQG
jgi:class 3 adenylate cyclase